LALRRHAARVLQLNCTLPHRMVHS
jgi:hypothetical protein